MSRDERSHQQACDSKIIVMRVAPSRVTSPPRSPSLSSPRMREREREERNTPLLSHDWICCGSCQRWFLLSLPFFFFSKRRREGKRQGKWSTCPRLKIRHGSTLPCSLFLPLLCFKETEGKKGEHQRLTHNDFFIFFSSLPGKKMEEEIVCNRWRDLAGDSFLY